MVFQTVFRVSLLALFVLFSMTNLAHDDHDHEASVALKISDLRINAPIPGQNLSAGYMNVTNQTDREVTIVRVSSKSAARIEMHTHAMEEGLMRMVKMESLSIPARESILFEQGGHHLMVFNPDKDAIEQGQIRVVFELSNDYVIPVDARIEELVSKKPSSNGHHHH